jgi:hypothetical protein
MSDLYEEALSYIEDRAPEYRRELDFGDYDNQICRDPNLWPSTDDVEDISLNVPYCGACGFRHSINSDWCKAPVKHREVA